MTAGRISVTFLKISNTNIERMNVHIPDGFIDIKTAVATGALSAGGLAGAIYGVKKYFKARVIAMMGVMSALIFALQMINFTIPGGTSGHLLGGVLAAIVMGPWAATLIMTAVIATQGLLFQDPLTLRLLCLAKIQNEDQNNKVVLYSPQFKIRIVND